MNKREQLRLREVKKFLKLDFNKSDDFLSIVELAAKLCNKPVALITLLDDKYNWLKVKYGTDIEVMPRETSFCQFGIQQNDILIIEDATKDNRFNQNPLVHSNPNLRFYAGVPLTLKNGEKLGTLCLFDLKPNALSELEQKALMVFAKQATVLMELEMSQIQLQNQMEQTEAKNNCLMKIAQLQSHQIRQPLTTLMSLINVIKDGHQNLDEQWLEMFETATYNFDTTIRTIVSESIGNKDLRSIHFNRMVEEIDDYAILILDEKGTIENWNKGAQKMKGYTSDEIIGKHFNIFYTPEDRLDKRPQQLLNLAKKDGIAKAKIWTLRKDSSTFWSKISIKVIYNETQQIIGFTTVIRDLTYLKKAEDAQLLSADMYNFMATYTSKVVRIGGWELDLQSYEVSWTSMTKEIHGVSEDFTPRLKTAINFYKKGENRIQFTKAVKSAIKSGIPWDLELQIITPKGEKIWVRTTDLILKTASLLKFTAYFTTLLM